MMKLDSTKLSQIELARLLGMSGASVSKLKSKGMPVDSVASAQAWREARQNVAQRKALPVAIEAGRGATIMPSLGRDPFDGAEPDEARDAARTRREIAEANLAEMEEARVRHELISVVAVKKQLALEYSTLREHLMQLPARLSPMLAIEGNAVTIQNILEAAVHQALTQLAGAADGVDRIEGAFD